MQASLQEDFELEIRKCTENQTFLYPEKQAALRSSELRLKTLPNMPTQSAQTIYEFIPFTLPK